MKKTILGISFLMMAAFAGSASAQSQGTTCATQECAQANCATPECAPTGCTPADCTQPCTKDKKDCKGKKDCDKKRGSRGQQCADAKDCPTAALFEGIALTETQQEKVKDLNEALKTSCQEARQCAKADSASCSRKDVRKELRTKYIDDLQKILTPEQFTTYLKNFYVNGGEKAKGFHGTKVFDKGKDRTLKAPRAEMADRQVLDSKAVKADLAKDKANAAKDKSDKKKSKKK